ncbi:FHA domain-containing protein [Bordetella muralis]|uniref:FHA domain-containing protein n=1 Tax=Bordetella muralis TaxID=1649130 RepID=UPI0039F11892
MFAKTSERTMRIVRAILLLGWLVLVLSLFWDPLTPQWTDPASDSPFIPKGVGPDIQGHVTADDRAYAMGPRIWWTMLVPLVPLFLMVFGHEAWRRICPLSLLSQIPRYLGLVRKTAFVQRASGQVEKRVARIKAGSWLDRNASYVQIGLLGVGLAVRLLFANGDRLGLAIFLLSVMAAALLVGTLWGGKTWCNYFCPVNVVQKIYTEPRGLLESTPHLESASLGQSSCRTPAKGGDKLACVGCTAPCGDIDLEGAYWETLLRPSKRNVYYIFYGLIWGFYTYYYLYAGSWGYYFSGYWTREIDQISHLMAPGYYIGGYAVPIPKLVAAPLTLLLFGALSLGLGKVMEQIYRWIRNRKRRVSEVEIINHCLSFTAFLSINTFYLFGGRPNLLMLPSAALHFVDFLIVALSALWLFTAVNRTPFKYRREGLAASLLGQLKKLNVDVSRYMEGRTIDDLQPDEVYVLSKVLPAYTREQKVQVYSNMLDEMIAQRKTRSAEGLSILKDLRAEMGVTNDEHQRLVDALGHDHAMELDPSVVSAREREQSLASYSELVGRALTKRLEEGNLLAAVLTEPEVDSLVSTLRASFQIDELEHKSVLENLAALDGMWTKRIDDVLDQMRMLTALKFGILQHASAVQSLSGPLMVLLRIVINERILSLCRAMLALLHAVGANPASLRAASESAGLCADRLVDVMMMPAGTQSDLVWKNVLDASLVEAVASGMSQRIEGTAAAAATCDAERALYMLASEGGPLSYAIAVFALSRIEPQSARSLCDDVLVHRFDLAHHWLVADVTKDISATELPKASHASAVPSAPIIVALRTRRTEQDATREGVYAEWAETRHTFHDALLRIGSSPECDLCLEDDMIESLHFLIRIQNHRVVGGPLGAGRAWINGNQIQTDTIIQSGDILALTAESPARYELVLTVPDTNAPYAELPVSTVEKLAALNACQLATSSDARALPGMSELARQASVRRYTRGALITKRSLPAGDICAALAGHLVPVRIPAHVLHDGDSALSPAPGESHEDWLEITWPTQLALEEDPATGETISGYRVHSAHADVLVWPAMLG